ncbi:hypothetical protein HGRIS_014301 [Hohenbuehelia grisea]|uniref:Uncharacterized protein n=1 Tax=Hohenbuehelia grisea TaxID=104357 RepID=A0ABR3JTT4_9AGAR
MIPRIDTPPFPNRASASSPLCLKYHAKAIVKETSVCNDLVTPFLNRLVYNPPPITGLSYYVLITTMFMPYTILVYNCPPLPFRHVHTLPDSTHIHDLMCLLSNVLYAPERR